jgi:hypothetical protein
MMFFLISTLPEIIFTEFIGSTPDLTYIKMAIFLVLSLTAVFWKALCDRYAGNGVFKGKNPETDRRRISCFEEPG